MLDDLKQAIKKRNAVLFVGSGVSAGLGVPTWMGLMDEIARQLKFDPSVFHATSSNYLTMAEFYKLKFGSIGPLRSWMDRNWNVSDNVIKKSDVHKIIVELDFPIIYTTNYDNNIENTYRIYNKNIDKVVDVRNLLSISSGDPCIIKLHGDFSSDDSIVLTETDYFNRLEFDSPLDIKLRSDVLAKPMLFIGYSMSDINVRLLLHKLWKIWDRDSFRNIRPPSYLFLTKPNEIEETVLEKWGVKVIVGDHDDPTASLSHFLQSLKC